MRKKTEIYNLFLKLKEARDSLSLEAVNKAVQDILEIEEDVFVNFVKNNLYSENNIEILAYMTEMIVEKKVKNRSDLILPLIQSPDAALRLHICGLLGNCEGKIAVEGLVDRLRKDEDANVRVMAAQALGRVGDIRATSYLIWSRDYDFSLDKDGWSVSVIAAKAIVEIEKRTRKTQIFPARW